MANEYTVHMISLIRKDGTVTKEVIKEEADYRKVAAWFGGEAEQDILSALERGDDDTYELIDLLTDPQQLLDTLPDYVGETIKGVVVEWYTYADTDRPESFNSGLAWARIDPITKEIESGNSNGLDLTARIKTDAEIW